MLDTTQKLEARFVLGAKRDECSLASTTSNRDKDGSCLLMKSLKAIVPVSILSFI